MDFGCKLKKLRCIKSNYERQLVNALHNFIEHECYRFALIQGFPKAYSSLNNIATELVQKLDGIASETQLALFKIAITNLAYGNSLKKFGKALASLSPNGQWDKCDQRAQKVVRHFYQNKIKDFSGFSLPLRYPAWSLASPPPYLEVFSYFYNLSHTVKQTFKPEDGIIATELDLPKLPGNWLQFQLDAPWVDEPFNVSVRPQQLISDDEFNKQPVKISGADGYQALLSQTLHAEEEIVRLDKLRVNIDISQDLNDEVIDNLLKKIESKLRAALQQNAKHKLLTADNELDLVTAHTSLIYHTNAQAKLASALQNTDKLNNLLLKLCALILNEEHFVEKQGHHVNWGAKPSEQLKLTERLKLLSSNVSQITGENAGFSSANINRGHKAIKQRIDANYAELFSNRLEPYRKLSKTKHKALKQRPEVPLSKLAPEDKAVAIKRINKLKKQNQQPSIRLTAEGSFVITW